MKPLGARVIVEEIVTSLSLVERGKLSGLTVITDQSNQPKPTQGKVLAVGNDPILRDSGIEEGSVVTFAQHAGTYVQLEGKQYRSLEFQELIAVTNDK